MPQQAWSKKRERQYEDIKNSLKERGRPRAEQIAARTVNKERARAGESKQRSKTSTKDMSSSRRGGLRSGNRTGPGGRTKAQLYEEAKRKNVHGRSSMNKAELERALARA